MRGMKQVANSILDGAAELARAELSAARSTVTDMPDAHTRIDSLKEDIREIGYSILDLQAKAQAHDAKLELLMAAQLVHAGRFDGIDARLDSVDARLDSVDGRFDSVDGRFDQIDAQLAEMLARLPQRPE